MADAGNKGSGFAGDSFAAPVKTGNFRARNGPVSREDGARRRVPTPVQDRRSRFIKPLGRPDRKIPAPER